MEDHIQQPWDIEADRLQNDHGGNLNMCRDLVIIDWLLTSGDTRPYADWVLRYNHQPGLEVNRLLAIMMNPDPNPRVPVPYGLVKRKRSGDSGRPIDLVVKERDRLLFENISRIMKEAGKGSYDSAIKQMAELEGITARTAKAAYDELKKS